MSPSTCVTTPNSVIPGQTIYERIYAHPPEYLNLAFRLSRSLKVIWNQHGSICNLWLLFVIQSNHGPISHRFRDKRRFQLKIANFSHTVYLTPPPPPEGVPLGIFFVTAVEFENLEWRCYQVVKVLDDVSIRLDTIRKRDAQTDRRTDFQ